ncbi:oxidoreductase [Endozoicomonas acroporae]|uniref:oxidoreductase n=1 Tax=Endozoicomonas acroporae TaxID=1701104 RepID=UPI000C7708CF|nr:oxidoreductase [Endozoicomonas acroporae]
MEKLLENKQILIAGAGGLLGSQLIADSLAQGAKVIAADINLEQMKKKLKSLDVNIERQELKLACLDVTDERSVVDIFSKIEELDGAVNTTYPRNKTYGAHFFDVSLASFNENLALHLGSTFLFSQQSAAYFNKNKKPFSLVNISSIYGVVAPKFEIYQGTNMSTPVEYAAIKSAIIHLNKYVAAYVNDSRFRVNSVSPGGLFDHQPESFLKAYKKNTHGQGMLTAKDVIGSILFLLSDQSKYVTGNNLIIDDGFTL